MSVFQRFRRLFRHHTPARQAYDQWAPGYDDQPGNLMLALDQLVFSNVLRQTDLYNKNVVDIGCGTGRHWPLLLAQKPASLSGYDVSEGMLARLRLKYPAATLSRIQKDVLTAEADQSCDVLVSTLTIAHIPDARKAFREWARILRPGGDILLTDYHPDALAKGASRSFETGGKKITIRNHVHSLEDIQQWAARAGLSIVAQLEKNIDETARPYYAAQGALALYEQYKGTPIIYAMHLKKEYGV